MGPEADVGQPILGLQLRCADSLRRLVSETVGFSHYGTLKNGREWFQGNRVSTWRDAATKHCSGPCSESMDCEERRERGGGGEPRCPNYRVGLPLLPYACD